MLESFSVFKITIIIIKLFNFTRSVTVFIMAHFKMNSKQKGNSECIISTST